MYSISRDRYRYTIAMRGWVLRRKSSPMLWILFTLFFLKACVGRVGVGESMRWVESAGEEFGEVMNWTNEFLSC